eukprot:7380013-Prymnesium_polylepis.2
MSFTRHRRWAIPSSCPPQPPWASRRAPSPARSSGLSVQSRRGQGRGLWARPRTMSGCSFPTCSKASTARAWASCVNRVGEWTHSVRGASKAARYARRTVSPILCILARHVLPTCCPQSLSGRAH